MKINLLWGLLGVVWMTACSNPLHKSVGEELTPEELSKISKKEESFRACYAQVKIRRNYLRTTLPRAEWADLTYQRYYKFYRTINDEEFIRSHEETLRQEWAGKYGPYLARVEAISDQWKDFLKENALDTYVQIELLDVEKEQMVTPWGETITPHVLFVFRVTPLRGALDALEANYAMGKKGEPLYCSYSRTIGTNTIDIDRPLTGPTLIKSYATLGFAIDDDAKEMDFGTLLRKYDWGSCINAVVKNGKRITNTDLWQQVPDPVWKLWQSRNREAGIEWEREWAIKRIVEEILQGEYVSPSDYVLQGMKKVRAGVDELSARFYDF